MITVPYTSFSRRIEQTNTITRYGKVRQVVGLVIESDGPSVSIGRLCQIENLDTGSKIQAEVVGFRENRVLLMPLGSISGVAPGAIVTSTSSQLRIPCGEALIGRVLGGLGQPIDGKGPIHAESSYPVINQPIPPLKRKRIEEPIHTGIKVIDLTTTVGKGQRVGIFSGSGVGKSVLLGMIARGSSAQVNVLALIGERGREVREFIENDLGEEGMKRSVVIAVTSDQPALVRIKGAQVATAIAESFRDAGIDVLLMMDSLTRVAMAQREIGLAVGEPPATKGYTPSVFALLPQLLERAGQSSTGSLTGLYTVLVEGDDLNEPVSDMARSILDGHVALSRKLASMNQYPAVDVLDSISRVMKDIISPEDVELAGRVREIVSTYRDAEDLINIGAYAKGSNPKIDIAIQKIDKINQLFRQGIGEMADYQTAREQLRQIILS